MAVIYSVDSAVVEIVAEKASDLENIAATFGSYHGATDHLFAGCHSLVILYANGYGSTGGVPFPSVLATAINGTLTLSGKVILWDRGYSAEVTP